jgi:hypothetical protein
VTHRTSRTSSSLIGLFLAVLVTSAFPIWETWGIGDWEATCVRTQLWAAIFQFLHNIVTARVTAYVLLSHFQNCALFSTIAFLGAGAGLVFHRLIESQASS